MSYLHESTQCYSAAVPVFGCDPTVSIACKLLQPKTLFIFLLSRLTGRSSTPVVLLLGGVHYTPHFYWSMHGGGGRGMRREATARGAAEAAKDVATEELERLMEVAAREIPRGDRVRKYFKKSLTLFFSPIRTFFQVEVKGCRCYQRHRYNLYVNSRKNRSWSNSENKGASSGSSSSDNNNSCNNRGSGNAERDAALSSSSNNSGNSSDSDNRSISHTENNAGSSSSSSSNNNNNNNNNSNSNSSNTSRNSSRNSNNNNNTILGPEL